MTRNVTTAQAPIPALRRILARQLSGIVAKLKQRRRSDRATHEVRKELKRARAALRLLRDCLGTASYRQVNALLRDAARPLTGARDSKVLLESLRQTDSSSATDGFAAHFARILRKERRLLLQTAEHRQLLAAAATLRGVKQRLEALPQAQLQQGRLSDALERAYKSAHKSFSRAQARPTDERLHECRKQAKYLFNQLDLIGSIGIAGLEKKRKRAERLAEYLGDDHDLALLVNKIFQHVKGSAAHGRNDAAGELINRIVQRRKILQAKARRLGARLYRDKPRAFTARIAQAQRAALKAAR